MKLFDTFPFFNELELLDIRLHVLNDHVDYFVLSEATTTFSGHPKRLYYEENKSSFRRFHNKIIHHIVNDTPSDFRNWSAPNPYYTSRDVSYPHKSDGKPLRTLSLTFQREVYQRDSIINPLLRYARDNDIVLVSDADEIPSPNALRGLSDLVQGDALYHFRQRWHMYYLNVICDRDWFGTRACRFSYLKKWSVDLVRHHMEDRRKLSQCIIEDGGWHFSFLGGGDRVREKLSAYDYQGRRSTPWLRLLDTLFKSRVEKKIKANRDIFLSDRKFFTTEVDGSYPEYLRTHREKFKKLIKA